MMVHHRSVPGAKNNHAVRHGAGPLANEAQSWFGNWIARGTCRRQRQRQRGPWWTWTHGHLLLEIGGHMQTLGQRRDRGQGGTGDRDHLGRDRGPGTRTQGRDINLGPAESGQVLLGLQRQTVGIWCAGGGLGDSSSLARRCKPHRVRIRSAVEIIMPPLGLSQVRRCAGIFREDSKTRSGSEG